MERGQSHIFTYFLKSGFSNRKKGVRAGGLESGAELAGKKVMAVALEDTDGSASHPYQFFSKKRSASAAL